jgi:hypothetical protein
VNELFRRIRYLLNRLRGPGHQPAEHSDRCPLERRVPGRPQLKRHPQPTSNLAYAAHANTFYRSDPYFTSMFSLGSAKIPHRVVSRQP